jgi:hypothetical protein
MRTSGTKKALGRWAQGHKPPANLPVKREMGLGGPRSAFLGGALRCSAGGKSPPFAEVPKKKRNQRVTRASSLLLEWVVVHPKA